MPTPQLTAPLLAIIVLVVGAALVLLLAQPLSARPGAASAIGVVAAVVAAVVGLAGAGSVVALAVPALCGVGLVALLLAPGLDLPEPNQRVEATGLLLLGTAGALALASAGSLVEAVVGQETLALAAVTLIALSRGEAALEAAFKYFTLGAISLAALLYGVGLVYLGTGSFAFPTAQALAGNLLVVAGVALVAAGFAFEIAVFPFQWGAIDAYSAGAPALSGFVMSASKIGAAVALGRLIAQAGAPIDGLLVWLGCLTIIWGTFGAIAQRELRRMLAYSAVTHAGFVAVAVGSGPTGLSTAAFYTAIYAAMAMLIFAALAGLGTVALPIDRLGNVGMGPGRAAALALGLFSLSGIPPTPGFWAKLAVLVAAWQHAGWLPAVIVAAGGVFSVLYYLRPIPDLFATIRGRPLVPAEPGLAPALAPAPEGGLEPAPVAARPRSAAISAAVVVAAIAVVLLGLFPGLAWLLA
jgi:NADH-quinone oxidoreductase subunit N